MRPIVVSITGLTADDDGVSASQTVPGAAGVVIDGAYSSGYSATSIATTTSNGAGTTTVTINGARAVSGVAYLPVPSYVVLVSAGNDSTKTWTVVGLGPDNYTAQSETVAAANASRVATIKKYAKITSVTLSSASAGNVSVGVNGVATITQPRRIAFTSGGNDTSKTFTISGADWAGNSISEAVTGASGAAAYSVLSYKTVTSIITSGSTAGTLIVGSIADSVSGGAGASPWVFLDAWSQSQIAIQATVSGTVNYTIQQTLDDPNDPTNAVARASMTWVSHPDADLVAATATAQGNYAYSPKWARILLNSGSGSVTATFAQANVVSA